MEPDDPVEKADEAIERCEALIKRTVKQKRDINQCIEALNALENDIETTDNIRPEHPS